MTLAERRVRTIPNAITTVRIAGIPVFLALLLQPETHVAALIGLALLAATDWVDGALARALHQESELGRLLDPIADHLLLHATGFGLAATGYVPWWIAIAFATGDATFAVFFATRRKQMLRLRVHRSARLRALSVGIGYPLAVFASLMHNDALHLIGLTLLVAGVIFQVDALVGYLWKRAPSKYDVGGTTRER